MTQLTIVCVSFSTRPILQTIRPSAFVLCVGGVGLPNAVPPFEPLRPFSPVYPSSSGLHAQAVSLSVLPLSFKRAATETKRPF